MSKTITKKPTSHRGEAPRQPYPQDPQVEPSQAHHRTRPGQPCPSCQPVEYAASAPRRACRA